MNDQLMPIPWGKFLKAEGIMLDLLRKNEYRQRQLDQIHV